MIQPQYNMAQCPPTAMGAGANAVSINIHNPQAFATPPQSAVTQPIYNYPQAQLYAPQPYMTQQQMPAYPQPYFQPAYNYPQAQMYAPQPYVMQQPMQTTQAIYQAPEVYPVNTTPVMPEPVLAPQQSQVPVAPAQQTPPVAAPEPAAQATPQADAVDIQMLNQELASQDLAVQEDAITKIAQYSQAAPELALQLVDNQIMGSLANIIQADSSKLPGPSQQQIDLTEKARTGQKLAPQEEEILKQSSPREMAEKNKVFSMFTLAMLQKLQRDEVDAYNASAGQGNTVPPIKIQDLAGYQQIVNTAQTSQIPDVRAAAIQALAYAARPEDAQVIQDALMPIGKELEAAKDKANPIIMAAYQEAVSKIFPEQVAQAQAAKKAA